MTSTKWKDIFSETWLIEKHIVAGASISGGAIAPPDFVRIEGAAGQHYYLPPPRFRNLLTPLCRMHYSTKPPFIVAKHRIHSNQHICQDSKTLALFSFGTFDSFLGVLGRNNVYIALPKQHNNTNSSVQQRRQQVLRANIPITYTVIKAEGEMSSGGINNLSQCTAGGVN